MQIQSNSNYNNTNFKSAFPVFVMVGKDKKTSVPAVDKIYDTCRVKMVHMLNNSLKKGVDPKRDAMAANFRSYFKEWVTDFYGFVTTFTCVDGGIKKSSNKVLKDSFLPQCYITTEDTAGDILRARESLVRTRIKSNWNKTAEVYKSNSDYKVDGEDKVKKAFKNFHPFGEDPHAMIVYFEPVTNKKGKIIDYRFTDAKFTPVENVDNPSIKLDRLV